MSESDYERGLRGGDCNVSISDYERWKDWKDGNDEYEREQDRLDEERIMELLTPAENRARINARIEARKIAEIASAKAAENAKLIYEQKRAHTAKKKGLY